MKKILLILLLTSVAVSYAQTPYPGTTVPFSQDQQPDSLKKINTILIGSRNLGSGQVTTSTSAASIAARATRRGITVRNLDSSITIYIGGVGVTSSTGMPLKAGESIAIDTSAAVYYIAASGAPILAFLESYD